METITAGPRHAGRSCAGGNERTQCGAFGERIGKHFRVSRPPTTMTRSLRRAQVAFTRLRSDAPAHGMTNPLPREPAFIITLQLRDASPQEVWLDGERVPAKRYPKGSMAIVDLGRRPSWYLGSPFDFLQVYLPRDALDEIAAEHGRPPIDALTCPAGISVLDPVVRQLGSCLLPALEHPEEASPLFVDHLALALGAHIAHTYGGTRSAATPPCSGLAPWQERRAKEFIDAHLTGDVSLARLAGECELSLSHFARSFRQSTGLTPHRWLLERRIEKSKSLLLDFALPLADIALACGFADQSHFTRVFSRMTGSSPGVWRRMKRT